MTSDDGIVAEVEALCAIYGPQNVCYDPTLREITVKGLKPASAPHTSPDANDGGDDDAGDDCCFSLTCILPSDYPSMSPPYCQVSAPWLHEHEIDSLSLMATNLFSPGAEVLWELIEAVRAQISVPHRNTASPRRRRDRTEEALGEPLYLSTVPVSEHHEDDVTVAAAVLSDCSTTATTIRIDHGETIIDRRSIFQAHIATVKSYREVCMVRDSLLSNHKIARATHNIMAYRIFLRNESATVNVGREDCDDSSPTVPRRSKHSKSRKPESIMAKQTVLIQDHDSDGESQAGGRLQHLLEVLDVRDIVVVVSRWYGGILLGPDRFKHINNAARQALLAHGHITDERKHKSKAARA